MHDHSPALKLRVALLTLLAGVALTGVAVGTASAKNGADDTTNPGTTTGVPHAPSISDIEVDAIGGGRLRLRAQVAPRGAKVTSVKIRYRGVSYKATRTVGTRYARTVDARGGDHADSVIALKVSACAGARCATRTGSDDA